MVNNYTADATTQLEMYKRMTLISQNDEMTRKVIRTGRLVTPYYSPKGQEAIPSAVSVSLRSEDQISTIYRGVHDMLAKGIPLETLWAEQAGRTTGACKGKGGPMHVSHPGSGVMVTTGIVGSSMPIANGLAWAFQLSGGDQVVVAYFGDGATNIGAFHEALNLASVWKLPVIFVCQNNRYGEHTRYAKATAALRVADRAVSYNIPGIRVDGNDPLEVYSVAREAIERARSGEGPTLIEAMTFRFYGHVMGDADRYMDKAEKAAALAADPTKVYRAKLIASGVAKEEELAKIETELQGRIEAAVEYALASPWPGVEELERDVYAQQGRA
jgi:acetoin:2,6-dichlorophenolindophenol oxidoreductase subunit alpha